MNLLAGPLTLLPGIRLWIAASLPSQGAVPVVEEQLAAAELHEADFHRWRRYRAPEKRRQFLNSRRVVREVLRLARCEFPSWPIDDAVRFCNDAEGRPQLLNGRGEELLSISLSHSGNIVAVAISEFPQRAGVDVEVVLPLRTSALMNSMVTPREREWLVTQPQDMHAELLRTLWVTKEAVWKTAFQRDEFPLAEISTACRNGRLSISSGSGSAVGEVWQTVQFVVNCEPVCGGTVTIENFHRVGVAVRGCVAGRISEPSAVANPCA